MFDRIVLTSYKSDIRWALMSKEQQQYVTNIAKQGDCSRWCANCPFINCGCSFEGLYVKQLHKTVADVCKDIISEQLRNIIEDE